MQFMTTNTSLQALQLRHLKFLFERFKNDWLRLTSHYLNENHMNMLWISSKERLYVHIWHVWTIYWFLLDWDIFEEQQIFYYNRQISWILLELISTGQHDFYSKILSFSRENKLLLPLIERLLWLSRWQSNISMIFEMCWSNMRFNRMIHETWMNQTFVSKLKEII